MKKRKRIVTIGGGTGSFTILSGLKKFPVELSAVVSMADDGGSTGILRDELGVLPPGDVRQCLVALSESSDKLRDLMNYRFEEGALRGHSFGNLFLSALEKVNGGFANGLEEAMEILKVRGEVIPVTDKDVSLELVLGSGEILHGENEINQSRKLGESGVKTLRFTGPVRAYDKAVRRLKQADMIVIGPGNLYCSLLPNLIIGGIARAIRGSKAEVVYVANLTNKGGHTSGWNVADYVAEIECHIGQGRIDAVIWNADRPDPRLVRKYEAREGKGAVVGSGEERSEGRGYRLVLANVLSKKIVHPDKGDAIARTRAFLRHDPDRLARAVMFLLESKENRRVVRDIR